MNAVIEHSFPQDEFECLAPEFATCSHQAVCILIREIGLAVMSDCDKHFEEHVKTLALDVPRDMLLQAFNAVTGALPDSQFFDLLYDYIENSPSPFLAPLEASVMEQGKAWAEIASQREIKAFLHAGFHSLPDLEKANFIQYLMNYAREIDRSDDPKET